jgi:hypothetical protein
MERKEILETSESYDQIKVFMQGAGQSDPIDILLAINNEDSLRKAKVESGVARKAIEKADSYFSKIGVKPETPTRIPGNRK